MRTLTAKRPKLSEAHIQETCDAFMELDGWRIIKTDLKHLRGLGVQEPGMPDRGYIRYEPYTKIRAEVCASMTEHQIRAEVELLWVEYKRKGGKAALHQKDWHAAERARGALTWIAGDDFPASIEGFQAHYRSSGLMRRNLR